MPIEYHEATRTFFLQTRRSTYAFCIFDRGYLMNLYWGRPIDSKADLRRLWRPCPSAFSPNYAGAPDMRYSLDLIPCEYPTYGGGDFNSPALTVTFPSGSRLLDLTYVSHAILPSTREPDGLPGLSGGEQTLQVLLRDDFSGLEVELSYGVYPETDVITRCARILNTTGSPLRVDRALSTSITLSGHAYELLSLYGSHIRERYVERTPLHHGVQALESRRGTSSHQQSPFMALVAPETTEETGEAYGMTLVYSGNFLAQAQVTPYHDTRVQIGIHPTDFAYHLEPGEHFTVPQAVMTYSDAGLGQMSRNFHTVFRQHLGHSRHRKQPRPIVINNWEGTYFDFNEEVLLSMIDRCAGLGIDMFVLDDGWFGQRNGEAGSLGDWVVNRQKLPHGLTPLIERCESLGMGFGLWFEPEMVSEDSDLFRAHPDWCIRQPGRPYCLGRSQLILDLSRNEVIEHIGDAVSRILQENRISYVKWDMNRHFTDAFSTALPPERQPELFHRYIVNLYRLMDRLTTDFPQVIFEGCSGGGGRFDAGILYYQPQIWTSDNSDAISRLKIQYGTSMVFPPLCMTAHVSASPNHQMKRETSFRTRGLVAMSASFGYELDPRRLTEEERRQVAAQTARYRRISPLIAQGDFYRLVDPFRQPACGWMFVSPDKTQAVVTYVRQLAEYTDRPLLRLAGLDPERRYFIEEREETFGGDELMHAGLALPMLKDFEALSFTLQAK